MLPIPTFSTVQICLSGWSIPPIAVHTGLYRLSTWREGWSWRTTSHWELIEICPPSNHFTLCGKKNIKRLFNQFDVFCLRKGSRCLKMHCACIQKVPGGWCLCLGHDPLINQGGFSYVLDLNIIKYKSLIDLPLHFQFQFPPLCAKSQNWMFNGGEWFKFHTCQFGG